jgi:hypothetical protein
MQRTGTRTVISKKKTRIKHYLEPPIPMKLGLIFRNKTKIRDFMFLGRSRLETKFLDPFMCGKRIETSIILI